MTSNPVSKGVFAFPNSKTRKEVNGIWNSKYGFIKASRDDLGKKRFHAYESCLKYVSEKIENLMEESHSKVFIDIATFISNANEKPLSEKVKHVPAAFLVTGVNMPDHDDLFAALLKLLRRQVTNHAVVLTISDCDKLRTMIRKICCCFMEEDFNEDLFIDEDEEEKVGMKVKAKQRNFFVLSRWYQDKYSTSGMSPTKKLKALSLSSPEKEKRGMEKLNWQSKPPLVIIIEKSDRVPSHILEEFICYCSKMRGKLPFVLIFGVASTVNTTNFAFRPDVTSNLNIHTFRCIQPTELLSIILDKVLLCKKIPFRLDHGSFRFLTQTFYNQDLSIRNFTSVYKFFMMEHFLSSPGAFLCCKPEDREHILNDPIVISNLLSHYSNISKCPILNVKNHNDVKNYILEKCKSIDQKHEVFCILVRVLHILVCDLPGIPLGKTLGEVAESCLDGSVLHSPEYEKCLKLILQYSKETFLSKLNLCKNILKEHKMKLLTEFSSTLSCYTVKIANASSEIEKAETPKLTMKNRTDFRETLHDRLKNTSAQKTEFYRVKVDTVQFFKSWFSSYLKPLTDEVLSEAFVFKPKIKLLEMKINGSYRMSMRTALLEPYKYLGCKCCVTTEDEPYARGLPDLSRCFKLHLECGRLINLYDWMQMFSSQLSDNKENDVAGDIDPKLHARFIRAASELQFIGCIKPTKSKTDHVERLPGCGTY